MACNTNKCNHENKTQRVKKIIREIKDQKAQLEYTASKRQYDLFDTFIKMLELMPAALSLKDVRSLCTVVYDGMHCSAGESNFKSYRAVFSQINSTLTHLIDEEMKEQTEAFERSQRCRYCQRAIDAGLMDETEHWLVEEGKVTLYQVALWVEMYAERHPDMAHRKWAWAKEKFGIERLGKARDESINLHGKVEGEEIIFEIFKD